MRSGVPLSTLREEILLEAGLSAAPGHSAHSADRIRQMVNRTERLMATQDEWPMQHYEQTITVAADAQYVDLPSDITYTSIESVHVAYGSEWLPVVAGIGARERTIYNTTQRALPISRYEYSQNAPGQIEVWPIGSSEQTLMIQGKKTLGMISEETDTCTLDGDVIVMRVAAQILGRDRKDDAELLLSQAQAHTNDLLKRQGGMKREPFNLGNRRRPVLRPGIDYIPPE